MAETFGDASPVSNGMPELLVIGLIVSAVFVLLSAMALRYKQRELQHRECMAAIERGVPLSPLDPTSRRAPWTPHVYLHRGLTWLFIGIAVMVFLFTVSLSTERPRSVEDRVAGASFAKQRGATDEQIRAIMDDRSDKGVPPAFSLIGLIPAAVGLAYLITYRVERSQPPAA